MAEILMNLSESLMYLFLVNTLIPPKNKDKTVIQSIGFVFVMTGLMCVLSFFDLNSSMVNTPLTSIFICLYTFVRNKDFSLLLRISVTVLSSSLLYFSINIAFALSYYLFPSSVGILDNAFPLIFTVAVSRISYFIMGSIIVYFRRNKLRNLGIKRKQLSAACIIFALYMYTYEGLVPMLNQLTGSEETAYQIMLFLCVASTLLLIFFYFVLKSNYLSCLLLLEDQKKEYEEKKALEFTNKIDKIGRLKNEIIELMTPIVQTVNDFEYEDARQLIEEYLENLKCSTENINFAIDNDVETEINLKIEEAKSRNICTESTILAEKKVESMFNNNELKFVITNLFDISMMECDNNGDIGSLKFTYYTGDSGVFLETEYKNKPLNEILSCSNIESLSLRFLKDTLSRLGGYSTAYNDEGKTKRKVVLPYVGKSYFLKGAGSRP